ncbi:MAG: RDD family protein [Desulfuromonadales bacterium]|nr:RDD family protein [Desulfuromonadales bacterium]
MSSSSSSQPQYASPWKRLVAFLIDLPVLVILTAICRTLLTQFEGLEYVAGWIYYAAMESSGLQATLGKQVLGLKVTGLQGNRVGFLRASGRYWGKLISVVSLGAGFAVMFFTEKHQTFHDYVSGCVIVDERAAAQASARSAPGAAA